MADSPLHDADGPISIDILSNGSSIPDTYEVLSVRTRNELNRVAEAMITVGDGDPASQKFPVADSDDFKPGSEIEIKSGYANRTKSIFNGVVTAVRLRIDSTRGMRLEITCRHKAAVLLQGRRRAVFAAGKKDSDLISDVVSAAGLSVDVESTVVELPEFVRFDVTDWDFVVSRAELNSMVVSCIADGLSIGSPDFAKNAELQVTFGEDLIAMDMEISARGQYPAYETAAWDAAAQEMESDSVKATGDNTYGNLKTSDLTRALNPESVSLASSASHNSSAISEFAKARAIRSECAKVQGWVAFQGNASVLPNTTLQLAALGDRFTGKGLIGGVVHRIESGFWKTEVQFGLPSEWVSDRAGFDAPAASAVASGTRGLVIGKVTQLDEDPDGLSRIQVAIPEFDQGATPLWARLGASYASSIAGCMFLPEIDDEVIVGFFNDNPSCPVILGSLHSPKAKPPEGFVEYDKENNTKAIVTREQLKVIFDEEKKILTLETPGGNTVELDDDSGLAKVTDQNGNKITLDSSGITLDSASDIAIQATGNIDITAGGNLKMSGVDVSASGSAGFKASGGGSAELSAGGTTKVAGALVQIN